MRDISTATQALPAPAASGRLGQAALGRALISEERLASAAHQSQRSEARLADTLRLSRFLHAEDLIRAEGEAFGLRVVDPLARPPDPRLIDAFGARDCIRHGLVPWRHVGGCVVVLTARPDEIRRHEPRLVRLFGPLRFAVTTERRVHAAVERARGGQLAQEAEVRSPLELSCRTWNGARAGTLAALTFAGLGAGFAFAPQATVAGLLGLVAVLLLLMTALRVAAGVLFVRRQRRGHEPPQAVPARLPVVSIMVPLFREQEIATALVRRLQALDYPRQLLDICLVLEEDDLTTIRTLEKTRLPVWMRAITVPRGRVRTKPRALNYALDFCRGSIIGVLDAEDAPAPGQINEVVERFAGRGPQVACLQGILDFYNSRSNWMSRCFTLEYATWFRLILPALQEMGLAVPLGGTTLYIRRQVLEELGGWDAHNVTEDADMGIRLARAGYRTEFIRSVTEEEANGRVLPWIRQRSRWLKGYALTYAVHMSRPRQLLRDLGLWRFAGFQLLFAGTLLQFLLAPLLWSFWAVPLGVAHPILSAAPPAVPVALAALFVVSGGIGLALSLVAAWAAGKGRLMGWTVTLVLYFPLGTLAAYKGLAEMVTRPFHWHKTAHGIFRPASATATVKWVSGPRRPRRQA